jgi:protoporphyrinogen oxidase
MIHVYIIQLVLIAHSFMTNINNQTAFFTTSCNCELFINVNSWLRATFILIVLLDCLLLTVFLLIPFYLQTESELVEAVDRDLRKMLINPRAADPLALGVRVWPQAIPQFLIGHLDRLDAAKSALARGGYSGLFLGGNYVAGVALGRCIEGAYESASEVSEFLTKYAYK